MAFKTAFKMPQEPRPLPSLDDDEESFVVLCSNARDSQSSDSFSPDAPDASVISEAKQLIKQELEALEMESMRCSRDEISHSNISVMDENSKKMASDVPATNKGPPESTNAMFSITSLTSDMSSDEIERKLSQLVEENVHLKDTILQNNMALKSQYDKILFWYEDVQKVHRTHKEKLIEAKRIIDLLKSEKDTLKRELTDMRRIKDDMEAEITRLKTNGIDAKRIEDDMKNLQLEVANAKIRELEETLEKLDIGREKSETNALLSEMEKLRSENEKSSMEIREMRENSTKLIEELRVSKENAAKLELQVIMKGRKEEQLTGQLARLGEKAEQVDALRAQLSHIQTKLTEAEWAQAERVDRSRKEPIDDEIWALKVQLDVYKADFEEERSAREAIKGEKDRLEEDLLNLQRRNQQLQEEIEILRSDGDFEPVGASRAGNSSSNGEPRAIMRCPKCAIKFDCVAQLERHVYRCIELDDHLP